jgi:hypothetical protein
LRCRPTPQFMLEDVVADAAWSVNHTGSASGDV